MEQIGLKDSLLVEVFQLGREALSPYPFEMIYLEWGMTNGKKVLRIFVDKKNGQVTLEDCTRVSEILSLALEAKDLLPFAYNLEVSSPGLNRPLGRRIDFEKNCGKIIRLESQEPISGRRNFFGRLLEIKEEEVEMEVDGENFSIPLSFIKKAHLDYFASSEETFHSSSRMK